MSSEIYADHTQTFLLPNNIDDWIGANHPARFINEFVNQIFKEKNNFKPRKSRIGRPNYSNRLLLKIWLYGYYNKIRSTRDLELACHRDIGLMWLTGLNYPDHNTLWRFFNRNRDAIKDVFKFSVNMAKDMNLVSFVIAAIDGTKIAADVSKEKTIHREDVEKILSKLDLIADEKSEQIIKNGNDTLLLPKELEDNQVLADKVEQAYLATLEKLDKHQTNHLNETDEDSRMMLHSDGKCRMSYNSQAVVDSKIGIITGIDVVQDQNDTCQLNHMLDESVETTGVLPKNTVADGGYYSSRELSNAIKKGNVVVNETITHKGRGGNNLGWKYHQDKFSYDEKEDVYYCPLGGCLEHSGWKKASGNTRSKVYRCRDYKKCPQRYECSSQARGRSIEIHEYKDGIIDQRKKNADPANKLLLRKRKGIVEPVFGYMKDILGFRRYSFRNLGKVRAQWALVACVVNLRKIYKYSINAG